MTTPEPKPVEPPDRPFQYSLRSLFGLTAGVAAFFSVGRTLGYADAVVALAAIVILVVVIEYPSRVHLPTGILLTIVAGVLLWANLRPTQWAREFDQWPPEGLDAVAESMFFRGWPLPAFVICPFRHMQFEPNNAAVYLILVLDGIAYVIALTDRQGCLRVALRWRGKPLTETSPRMPPPAGPTSGPLVE